MLLTHTIYSIYSDILKNFSKAILTSVPADAISNSVLKLKSIKKIQKASEAKQEELEALKKQISESSETQELKEEELTENQEKQEEPHRIEANALNDTLYNVYNSTFWSRIGTESIMSLSESFFKSIPLFKSVPSDLITQATASIVCPLINITLSENDMLKKAFNSNRTEKSQSIIDKAKDKPIMKFIGFLKGSLRDKIAPVTDGLLKNIFGIEKPELLLTEQGNPVLDEEGKEIYKLPKINYLKLGGTMLTSFLLTAFTLDKKTTAVGFEEASSPLKAFRVFTTTVFSRINTTLMQKVPSMLEEGRSWDELYENIISRKLLVPSAQYAVDAIAGILPFKSINPATKSNIGRMLLEFTIPPFEKTFTPMSIKNIISDEQRFTAHKFIKPILSFFANNLKSVYFNLNRLTYGSLGIMPLDIPELWERKEMQLLKDELPEDLKEEFRDKSFLESLAIGAKALAYTPVNVINWTKESINSNQKQNEKLEELRSIQNEIEKLKLFQPLAQ
ncbi:MAG: hypothetical protein MK033_03825 [Candidatus Caenarcaniphilales bacterium]|nr:hypothetical protein [Candidatus Caenarcaniphilales bacterium]